MNKNAKNLASFLIIGFLPYLINVFMLPVYSGFLSAEDFGIIGIAMAVMFISSSWSNFQLPGAISRIYFDYDGKELNDFISTLINSSIIICCAFCFIYVIASEILVEIVYGDIEHYRLHIAVVLSIFLSCTNTAFEKLMITQQRGGALLFRSLIAQLFSVISGVYFICYAQLGSLGFILSQSAYFAVMLIFSFLLTRSHYSFVLERAYFLEGVKYSFPLIFHALGGVVFMYSGAFFLKGLVGVSALGVFTVADRFSQIPKAVVNSFNNVYSPLYNKIKKKSGGVDDFSNASQTLWSSVFGVFSAYFVFLASSYIENYMTGDYSSVHGILFILVPSYVFRSMFCFSSAPIFFHKDTNYIPIITCLSGTLVLLLSYPIISSFSVYGAAFLVGFGFFVTFVCSELIALFKYGCRTFKFRYVYSFISIFLVNSVLIFICDFKSFPVSLIFSIVAGAANIIVFYHFDFFDFKKSVITLRSINE